MWYPIKDRDVVNDFYDEIESLNQENLIIHFSLSNPVEHGKLFSCGILLINPPFQTKETLESVLPVLSEALQASFEFVM